MVLYTMLHYFRTARVSFADSPTYRAFCLLGLHDPPPKRASIAGNLSSCVPQTLQAPPHSRRPACRRAQVGDGVSGAHGHHFGRGSPFALRSIPRSLRTPFACCATTAQRAQKWIPLRCRNHRRWRVSPQNHAPSDSQGLKGTASLCTPTIDDTKLCVEAALFAATYLEGIDSPKAYLLSFRSSRLRGSAPVCCGSNRTPSLRRREALLQKLGFSNHTLTFCASETVSCTECACRLGKRSCARSGSAARESRGIRR